MGRGNKVEWSWMLGEDGHIVKNIQIGLKKLLRPCGADLSSVLVPSESHLTFLCFEAHMG